MINLNEYSYSIRNSYISITKQENKLLVRNVGNGDEDLYTLFEIPFKENNITNYICTIGELVLYSKERKCVITFKAVDQLILNTEFELKLEFSPQKYEFASKIDNNILTINLYSKRSKILLVSRKEILMRQKWNVISSENLEINIQSGISKVSLSTNNFKKECFDVSLINEDSTSIEEDFKRFWSLEKIDYSSKLFEAQYILWSGFVYAKGNLKYDACYMSMNIMTNIWSWDNCFVALGLAKEQPQRAYEQFMSFEHVQSIEGNYPDFMNPDYVSYDFTKPPVQGVIYLELLKINFDFFSNAEKLIEVHKTCNGLLKYWTKYRTFNGIHNLAFNTHGNDTGLDNATIFDNTVTVRSPDLIVYLLKLIELLKYIEKSLEIESMDYSKLEKKLLVELTDKMFDGKKYVSYDVFTHEINNESMCIIELIPLLVCDQLPSDQQEKLLRNVDNFLTEYGLASEAPASKYYRSNGYWRGPIWAPTTCLCFIGLRNMSATKASVVKERYIEMCEQYSFAENFDAQTGEGLSDKAFAWTGAVYKYFKELNE